MSSTIKTPEQVLEEFWGYPEFRPPQREIISAVLDGSDTLALMPTGGGKSLCFQVPTLTHPGLTLVISPLIALMNDQVKALKKKGISAVALTSELDFRQVDLALENCMAGAVSFLYLSPERLRSELVRARLPQMPIKLIAVDEAHCISEWGYDFRPAYRLLIEAREWLPGIPVLALTASATPEVVLDIQEQLKFSKQHVIRRSFGRPNLAYRVWQTKDKFGAVLALLKKHPGAGIIYVRNRRKTQEIADYLTRREITAAYYHAGLDAQEKELRQDGWTSNNLRVIVATNAFGMGIDKPDVRWVLHWEPADCIESYFQEAGRAGRDEKEAVSYVFYDPRDGVELRERYIERMVTAEDVYRHYDALMNFLHLGIGSGADQAFDFDIKQFAKHYDFDLYGVYQTLDLLEKDGFWHLSDGYKERSFLHITANARQLYETRLTSQIRDVLIQLLLRSYPGITEEGAHIDENSLAARLKTNPTAIRKELENGTSENWWVYRPRPAGDRLWMTLARQPSKYLPWNRKALTDLRARKEERIQSMIDYLEQSSGCRNQALLSYFGEGDTPECGKCDLCLSRAEWNPKEMDAIIERGVTEWNDLVAEFPGRTEIMKERLAKGVEDGRWNWVGPEIHLTKGVKGIDTP